MAEDSKDHRQRAVRKLRAELQKDIGLAALVASQCGLWELLRLVYMLHFLRLGATIPPRRDARTPAQAMQAQLLEESVKYAICLVAKNGTGIADQERLSRRDLRNEVVNDLTHICQHINTKSEYESLFELAPVRVSGERDQHGEIDLSSIRNDPEVACLFDYGVRLEKHTASLKFAALEPAELLAKFRTEFSDVADLFQAGTGIALDDFCTGMFRLLDFLTERGKSVALRLHDEQGETINALRADTFYEFAAVFAAQERDVEAAVGKTFFAYLKRSRFRKDEASNSELRFHYLSRKPYIFEGGLVILSPQLVLDSLFVNTHFSLLERLEGKPAYVDRKSRAFVDKIAAVAAPFGFEEVGRDVFLTQGKKNFGDIDLHLRSERLGFDLLIEAKNHALPLDVYFRSAKKTRSHLETTSGWVRKVQAREAFLRSAASPVSLPAFRYVIVTLQPEPLSHRTDTLVLNLEEFEEWLKMDCKPTMFAEMYAAIYEAHQTELTEEELLAMTREGFSLFRTEKPEV